MMRITLIFYILSFILISGLPSYSADFTNSIGMQFKDILSGSFYMGSCTLTEDEKEANKKKQMMGLELKNPICPSDVGLDNDAADNETPQHIVHIKNNFQMSIYEVTVGQFKEFIVDAGREDLLTRDFVKYNKQGDDAAVCNVDLGDAEAFIRWLNRKEGGRHYRLPTEAEWEYAARGATSSVYSWGSSRDQAYIYAWYNQTGEPYVHPVGCKRPNPWGLYDMHGNVWEWVQTQYTGSYWPNSAMHGLDDDFFGGKYVLRGGSWRSNVTDLRSAKRGRALPGASGSDFGFRVLKIP